jgi:hypothetical protein
VTPGVLDFRLKKGKNPADLVIDIGIRFDGREIIYVVFFQKSKRIPILLLSRC